MPSPALQPRDTLVMIGSGSKAHVYRSHPDANVEQMELKEGGQVNAIALCGTRGQMVSGDEDTEVCSMCERTLIDDAAAAAAEAAAEA